MDLDEVADELYTLPPDGFMAARREREQQARAEGDRELAKAIASLPKPATAAWVSNVLVREHREEIESLVELGDLLREAQQNLAGDQLRALNAQRAQLLSALTRQAAAVARKLGHPISSGMEAQVEDTLRAAMADPEAGEAVLSGRLTSPLSYSGLGNVSGFVARPQLRVVPSPPARAERPARAPSKAKEEQRRQKEEEARRAAEAERRRHLKEARDAVEEATSAAREAIAAARLEQAHVEEFAARQEQLQARLDQLTAEVARVREQLNGAGAELGKAQRRLHATEKRRADATAARDAALARLDELSADAD